jgi:hypothetical protein
VQAYDVFCNSRQAGEEFLLPPAAGFSSFASIAAYLHPSDKILIRLLPLNAEKSPAFFGNLPVTYNLHDPDEVAA